MATTLKDVAREAGVNISTASRALNNAFGIHEDTRKQIIAVAARLDYRPNQVARGLVTGRSNSIGLVISDIRNPFFAELARGAEDAAFRAGCDLVLCNSDQDADKQMHYFDWLVAKRIDGVIMNSVVPLSPAQQDRLCAAGVPIVLLNVSSAARRSPTWRFSSVVADNLCGGEMAAKYLIGLGHRNVLHIGGPRNHGTFADRANGFLKVFRKSGLPKPRVIFGEHTFAAAYQSAKQALEADRRITAIFAGNDVIAFGCMRALMEKGIRVPEDISLLGFDNVEMAQITSPPLTTIDQPKYETGKAAMEILFNMMPQGGVREPEHRIIGVRLIERQSCKAIGRSVRAPVSARRAAEDASRRPGAAARRRSSITSRTFSGNARRRKRSSLPTADV
jgi:LacI family transcriptional regulator, galactose operon repressor